MPGAVPRSVHTFPPAHQLLPRWLTLSHIPPAPKASPTYPPIHMSLPSLSPSYCFNPCSWSCFPSYGIASCSISPHSLSVLTPPDSSPISQTRFHPLPAQRQHSVLGQGKHCAGSSRERLLCSATSNSPELACIWDQLLQPSLPKPRLFGLEQVWTVSWCVLEVKGTTSWELGITHWLASMEASHASAASKIQRGPTKRRNLHSLQPHI